HINNQITKDNMVTICKSIQALRSTIRERVIATRAKLNVNEPTIGFVPTMGYLHRGHISLVEQARTRSNIVVASIFVNPTQFAPTEDLAAYPTDIDNDVRLLTAANADILFLPPVKEMYGEHASTYVDVASMDNVSESKARPGHFRGVATIVTKLLNIVQPDYMFIGQKDAMQCVCLRRLVNDLAFNTEVVVGDTVREANGLAMSSRNSYLTQEEREEASAIYRSMSEMRPLAGSLLRNQFINQLQTKIESSSSKMKVEYISLASPENGLEITGDQPLPASILSLAVFFHGQNRRTRLIDVMIL
ncbi:hypothetical protein SAMD00019534_016410, partial [Acytostelium subglobosum LB1]|uniref:hypothetical protein n=1 Tax=Acytostelium subglobosum LB1 TaxID=1410327 RepID=UPI000644B8CF